MAINIIIFIVITSIYASWINMYSSLDKLNLTRGFDKLNIVETPVYHLEIQNIMNFLTYAYLRSNQFDIAQKIIKQSLKYWPNDYVSHSRYIHTLYGKKQYNLALEEFEVSKKITPDGFYNNYFLALSIYFRTKQYQKYIETYNDLVKMSVENLVLNNRTLPLLIANGLRIKALYRYIPDLYALYKDKSPYNCGVENNYLLYLSYQKDTDAFKKAYENEIKNPRNCVNKSMINKIKSLK